MATPTRIKCGSTIFEMREHSPKGSKFVLSFIQCASCGGVVGVMDVISIADGLYKIAEKVGVEL